MAGLPVLGPGVVTSLASVLVPPTAGQLATLLPTGSRQYSPPRTTQSESEAAAVPRRTRSALGTSSPSALQPTDGTAATSAAVQVTRWLLTRWVLDAPLATLV